MKDLEKVLKTMTLEFFGTGKHKISASTHLEKDNAVFLDIRSQEEYETLAFNLIYHMPVIHIPTDEIPDRLNEIPKDKNVGIFCSSGVRASMVYLYLQGLGYEKVRIIDGGYQGIFNELKPGKLLKFIQK